MSSTIRRAAVVLGGVGLLGALALLPAAAWGQKKRVVKPPPVVEPPGGAGSSTTLQPPGDGDFTGAVMLHQDNKLKKRIEAAQDLMKEEAWPDVVRILQGLLDPKKEDVFVPIIRKGPNGKDEIHWTSARAEANRMIGSLPAKGMEFYKLRYNQEAADLLKQAKENSDADLLARVAVCYLHTDAGAEATELFGTYEMDRGRFIPAALCFERLINRQGPDKLEPLTLFKAALAFEGARDRDNAATAWKALAAKAPEGLRLGDQTCSLASLKKEAQEKFGGQVGRLVVQNNEWLGFRGSPSRNAQGEGSHGFFMKSWRTPTIHEGQVREWVKRVEGAFQSHKQPVLPSFFPLALTADVPAKGRLPLVVFRSHLGIHAVDLKTGKLVWESESNWSLDKMVGDHHNQKSGTIQQWMNQHYLNVSLNRYNAVVENSTLGCLSSDGQRVYAVEDLAVPPPYFNQFWGGPWGGQPGMQWGALNDAAMHNRLQAFDVGSGKLLWELGGRADEKDSKEEAELKDTYFLGPPLPLGGKLYALADKNQELRLLCLDPVNKGAVQWAQSLASTREKILQDIGRRYHAALLSYGDGILVCPTNAGAILGVDLLSHSLVWAYAYREARGDEQPPLPGFGRRPFPQPGVNQLGSSPTDWKVAAPVITDGKVVFTAPDASAVHCVNLKDGSKLWAVQKGEDDQYMAGVFAGKVLIVGKSRARALNLADGSQAWSVETGEPSGQGVASNNIYYLPLRAAAKPPHDPEVCAIDLVKGEVVAHTKSREPLKEDELCVPGNGKLYVPSNLVLFEGQVISQNATDVTAFPQLKLKVQQMNEALAKNPDDPFGLTERGELLLDQGKVLDAVKDLEKALANNPKPELLPKTRTKLYDALTELFQRDFNAAEGYLAKYEALCKVDVPPDAKAAERQEAANEQRRRLGNFYCLVAKGREAQKKLADAFDNYQKFAEVNAGQELVSVIDEPSVKSPPEVWAAGRIASMIARADPKDREPLERKIAGQWDALKEKGSVEELQRFATLFDGHKAGREARLRLGEKLLEENGTEAVLRAEQQLHLLARQKDDPQLAARALEAMARLATRKGQMEDACHYYRLLARDFARVPVRDGKTGADFYNELATDKRFLPYLDVPAGMPGKVTRVEESRTVNQPNRILFTFEPEDDRLPYFQRYRVALDTNFNAFKLIDRKTGEEKWSQNISRSNYFQQFMGYNLPNMRVRHPFYGFGHLVVLNLGHLVFGIDPINQKVLWEKSLFGSQGMPQQSSVIVDPHDGQLVILYSDNFQQKLGYPGPVEAAYMAMVTRDGLVAFDPVSGKTLWTRSDVSPRSQLFGDDKYVYLVETNPDGTPAASRAFRASDGVTVNLPDFAPLYGRRVHVHGGKILLTDTDPQGGVTLRLYDVRSGKDLWSQKFAAGAVALQTEDPNLAGMVEPDGKVTVVDLHTRKVTMQGSVDPKHTAKAQAVYLLEDSLNYYVAVNGPIDPNVQPFGPPRSAFQPGTGVRALPVNGMFYAFERRTGKVKWYAEVQNQMVVMEHFKGLPMVLFASVYQKWAGGVNRFVIQVTEVKSFDKRSGKRIYDPDQQMNNGQQFFALNVDQRKVEMVSYNQRLTFHLPSGASDGGAKDPPGGGGIRPQPGQGIGQGQGGLQPGGGIRVRPRPPIIRQPLQPLPPQQRPLEKK